MRAAILAIGRADGLGHERHGARGPRVDLQHEDRAVLDGVLHVHQAADIAAPWRVPPSAAPARRRSRSDSECTGSEQALSPEWMPASSMCSRMPRDEGGLAVAEAVDVDLDGVGQIGVEQQRVLAEQRVDLAGLVVRVFLLDVLRHQAGHGVEQVALQHALVVDDLHGAAAEHIGRAHDQREAELAGDQPRLLDRIGDAVLRLRQAELHQAASGSGRGPRQGRSCRATCRGSGCRPSPARRRASAASGRRTAR